MARVTVCFFPEGTNICSFNHPALILEDYQEGNNIGSIVCLLYYNIQGILIRNYLRLVRCPKSPANFLYIFGISVDRSVNFSVRACL